MPDFHPRRSETGTSKINESTPATVDSILLVSLSKILKYGDVSVRSELTIDDVNAYIGSDAVPDVYDIDSNLTVPALNTSEPL